MSKKAGSIVVKEGTEGTAFDMAPVPTAAPYPDKNPVGTPEQVAAQMTDTRSRMVADVLAKLGNLDHQPMVEMYHKIMSQFGPERAPGERDTSAQNQASIAMKGSPLDALSQFTREDIAMVFGDDTTLTEEFKARASTLFESSVFNAITVKQQELQEEFDSLLVEEVTALRDELTTRVDNYLTYACEEWVKENKLALEESIRVDISNEFITGLKTLFKEHYVELPEGKVDLYKQVNEEVTIARQEIDRLIKENMELKTGSKKASFREILEDTSKDLTVLEQEKFKSLVKVISESCDSEADFKSKISIIKESYFPSNRPAGVEIIDGVIQEDNSHTPVTVSVDPLIAATAQYLAKSK